MGERAAVGVDVSAGMRGGPGGARPSRWGQWDPPSPGQRDRIERLRTEMATVRAMDVDLFHRFTQLLAEVRSLRLHLSHECASSSSSSSSKSSSSSSKSSSSSRNSSIIISSSVGEPCASTPRDAAEPPEVMTPPPRPPTPPHHRHRLLLHRCKDRPRCLHLPNSPPHSRETQPKATVDSRHDDVAQDDVGGDGGGERPGDRGLTLGSTGSSDSDDSTLRFRGPLPRLRICETPAEASSAEEEDEEDGGEETMGRGSSAALPRLPVVPGAPGAHERHGGHGGDHGDHGGHGGDEEGIRVVVGSAELHGEGSRGERGGGRAPRFGDRWRWLGEGTDASFV